MCPLGKVVVVLTHNVRFDPLFDFRFQYLDFRRRERLCGLNI